MILGKKDREYVKSLNVRIKELEHKENKEEHSAVQFLTYLHDDVGLPYSRIAETLGVSQQYINNLCLGKIRAKNESIYKMVSKLFYKE